MMPETVQLLDETLPFFSEKGAHFPKGKIEEPFGVLKIA